MTTFIVEIAYLNIHGSTNIYQKNEHILHHDLGYFQSFTSILRLTL